MQPITRRQQPIGALAAVAVVVCACAPITPSPSGDGSISPSASAHAPSPVVAPTDLPTPTDGEHSAGPPPLTELEQSIVDALAALGLEGGRGETPYDNAVIAVYFDSSHDLSVSALPIEKDRADYVVLGTRTTRGIEVEQVQSLIPGRASYRFGCGDLRYFVGGTAPPSFADLDAFIDAFLDVIDCTPPGGADPG